MKYNIFFIIIIILIIFLIFTISFILFYRDTIFYFKPKKTIVKTFDSFLNKYSYKKYKSNIGNVDVIDFTPNTPITSKKSKSNKVIIYFQGNHGNITTKERTLTILLESFNTRVIAVDYLKLKKVSIKNFVKLGNSIVKKVIKEGVDIDDIIIWGESIGCAIGLEVIALTGVKNFVMMAGFKSMRNMIELILPNKLGKQLSKIVYELDNEKKISEIKNLKMINLHSKDDELIPYEQVKGMIDKLNIEHYEITGAHNYSTLTSDIINRIKEKFEI
jgi:hypothetical protein